MLTFKIKGKLIGCVMVMFFVIFAVFVAVIVTKTTEMAQNEAYELLLARSAAEAKAVETEIGGAVQTAKTLAQTLGSYESITDADSRRGLFNEMLQTTIAANPQYLTVWTCWEPNALDGLDEKYKNTLFHDATGRYIPTFTNTGGTVTAEALVGYDKPNEGDYYFASFHSGKTLVSEPYKYNLNGKETLLISISTPVKNKAGRTVGVVGIDMSADVLNERNDQVNIFETGVGKLVSGGGMMVAAQHRQVIGKPDADFQDSAGQERLKKILSGSAFTETMYSVVYEENTLKSFHPVYIGDGNPWIYGLVTRESEVMKEANSLRDIIILVGIAGIILAAVILFFIANTITKPLNAAAQYVNKIAKGDLSKSVDKNLAAKSDESGEIARSIGAMQRAFKSIIEHVISLSVDSAKLINQSHDAMQELDRHIQETSSASMTLSANMQESAAAAEEMSATTHEIAASASLIAQKAAAGAENVKVISKRATELKMAVAQSQKETQQIREQIDAKLSKAIEESQSIEEINRLSESILQITAQTTLLSLNAAIEAARAGEQGRGFAVVANEIKNLADNSKDTVKEIQTITAVVINSVVHLVESSKEMLAFIDEKVVKDYENMVDTGETYDQDAKSVEIVLREFSEASSALSSSVETLLQAIESVAIASNDGAQNVIDIATKAAQVSALSEDVKNSIAEIKHSSLALGESVQVFKI